MEKDIINRFLEGSVETAFKAVLDGISTAEKAAKKAMEEYNTVVQTME